MTRAQVVGVDVIVIVFVIVIDPVIVAVHVHGNDTVIVIPTVIAPLRPSAVTAGSWEVEPEPNEALAQPKSRSFTR